MMSEFYEVIAKALLTAAIITSIILMVAEA